MTIRHQMNDRLIAGGPLAGPLYKEVKRLLIQALQSGEWKGGEALPAEKDLSSRFGVAIGTLRKAVDELVQEKILIRQQGRGTFVSAHNRDRTLFYFFHLVPREGEKIYPEVQLLSFERGRADDDAARLLGIDPGARVFDVRNLLRIDGEPVALDRIIIAQESFPGLTERRFRARPSTIYHLYQTGFGITVIRTSERLRATTADRESAPLLGVRPGAPLLEIRRIALDLNGDPVEFRRSLVNTERHDYLSDFGRNERA